MGGSPVPTSHTRTICSCWSTRTRLLQLEASSTLSYYARYFRIYSTFHYRQVLQLVGKKALWLPGSLPDHSHPPCVPHTPLWHCDQVGNCDHWNNQHSPLRKESTKMGIFRTFLVTFYSFPEPLWYFWPLYYCKKLNVCDIMVIVTYPV